MTDYHVLCLVFCPDVFEKYIVVTGNTNVIICLVEQFCSKGKLHVSITLQFDGHSNSSHISANTSRTNTDVYVSTYALTSVR